MIKRLFVLLFDECKHFIFIYKVFAIAMAHIKRSVIDCDDKTSHSIRSRDKMSRDLCLCDFATRDNAFATKTFVHYYDSCGNDLKRLICAEIVSSGQHYHLWY